MKLEILLNNLLKRTGQWYVMIAIVLSQLGASSTTILGMIFEQITTDYPPELSIAIANIQKPGILLAIATLLIMAYFLTRRIRIQLYKWHTSPGTFDHAEIKDAWKDVHSITWRLAIISVLISLMIIVIPKIGFLYVSGLATFDQVIFSLIGGIISTITFIPISIALLESFLLPVREVLLPENFEEQLTGPGNIRILYKNQALILISITLSALLIAPIGYRQTTKVLYEEIGSQTVLTNLQIQSVLMSIFAILFASGLSFLVTRSISNPINQLLKIFKKVEEGDLSTRVPVISSDEVGELSIYFNKMLSRLEELQGNLEEKVKERTAQLQAINDVGQAATSSLDLDELFHRIVTLITEDVGYYFAAIYLTNLEVKEAELKEASGEVGKVLKSNGHRIDFDEQTVIGHAIRARTAQVVSTKDEKATRFDKNILPYSQSEIALPLIVGNQILGILDVHSSQENAFSDDDVKILQNMANQVAIALDNARLFQETNQSLSEMRNIQKLYLQDAWLEPNLPKSGISLSAGETTIGVVKEQTEIPIALRDQVIGNITLEGDEPLSVEDQTWVEAVVAQAAFALENARLLEDTQSVAMREKFTSEIINKIWASTSIDGVLQTAVRELGQVLDVTEATIEINLDGE